MLLAFAGVLAAIVLRRVANGVGGRLGMGPRLSLGVVTLFRIRLLVGAFALSGPSIATEVRSLRQELPKAVTDLRSRLDKYEWAQRAMAQSPVPADSNAKSSTVSKTPQGASPVAKATGLVVSTLGGLGALFLIAFLGIVFAATPDVYVNGASHCSPNGKSIAGARCSMRLPTRSGGGSWDA